MTISHGSSYIEPLTLWRIPLQTSILPLMACSTVQEYSIHSSWIRTRYGGRLHSSAVQGIWRLHQGTGDRLLVLEGFQGWGLHPQPNHSSIIRTLHVIAIVSRAGIFSCYIASQASARTTYEIFSFVVGKPRIFLQTNSQGPVTSAPGRLYDVSSFFTDRF
jgi:hypothetical protein